MRQLMLDQRSMKKIKPELQLEVTLDEFAKFFAVFIAHVHKFDAASVRADVADDGGEIDLAKTGTNFKLDRIAHSEFPGGLQIGAAQTDCFYTRKAHRCARDLSAKRRVQRNSSVAPRDDIAGAGLRGGSKSGGGLLERRAILDQGQRVVRCRAQASGFPLPGPFAVLRQLGAK